MDEKNKYDVFIVNYNINLSGNGNPDIVKEVAVIASDNINKVMNFMRRTLDYKLSHCQITRTNEKSDFQGLINDTGKNLLKLTDARFEDFSK